MGTIVIEEYGRSGTLANPDVPITKIDTQLARTSDATTSTTAENVVLNKDTRLVRIYTAEVHRLAVGTDTTGSVYTTTEATKWIEFGVDGGKTLYYRTDA